MDSIAERYINVTRTWKTVGEIAKELGVTAPAVSDYTLNTRPGMFERKRSPDNKHTLIRCKYIRRKC